MHRRDEQGGQSISQHASGMLRVGGRVGNRAGPAGPCLSAGLASAGDLLDGRTAAELEAQIKAGVTGGEE